MFRRLAGSPLKSQNERQPFVSHNALGIDRDRSSIHGFGFTERRSEVEQDFALGQKTGPRESLGFRCRRASDRLRSRFAEWHPTIERERLRSTPFTSGRFPGNEQPGLAVAGRFRQTQADLIRLGEPPHRQRRCGRLVVQIGFPTTEQTARGQASRE